MPGGNTAKMGPEDTAPFGERDGLSTKVLLHDWALSNLQTFSLSKIYTESHGHSSLANIVITRVQPLINSLYSLCVDQHDRVRSTRSCRVLLRRCGVTMSLTQNMTKYDHYHIKVWLIKCIGGIEWSYTGSGGCVDQQEAVSFPDKCRCGCTRDLVDIANWYLVVF